MTTLSRRSLLGATALSAFALAACSDSGDSPVPGGPGKDQAAQFDEIVAKGPVASDDAVKANPWASKIRSAGTLRLGGTTTSPLFCLKDPTTGKVRGFDAGITYLLARYIFGSDDPSSKVALTEVSVDTRETLLINNSVDVVVATYSITEPRKKKISFAGPYYESGATIGVKDGNKGITSVEDLNGKVLVTQTNSTGLEAIKKHVPHPKDVLTFAGNAECQAAVVQGRADAYVTDQSLLMASAKQKGQIVVVGQPFTKDPYGIGVHHGDNDAVTFINGFLRTIFDDGTWDKLWRNSFSGVIKDAEPTPPALPA